MIKVPKKETQKKPTFALFQFYYPLQNEKEK